MFWHTFADVLKLRWDGDVFYVESNGLPDHPMMVGITAWQQQVPLPQSYTGANAWRIPLHPVVAKDPISAKTHFFRGAIALVVNGIPIFNPIKNDGHTDTLLAGELDEWGGHCGRADDYHYHIAPVHLEPKVGKGQPLGFALDGYAIYGYDEPDGSKAKPLDVFNGHDDAQHGYHYHATKTYPYINGGFHGEVTERGGQVAPQPSAQPVRPALPPLRGAKITGFRSPNSGSYSLTYEVRGQKNVVNYTLMPNGGATFQCVDSAGKTTTETYQRRERGPDGGPGDGPPGERGRGDRPPPGPDDGPPPDADRRPPPPVIAALDLDGNRELSADEIAKAPQSLGKLDRDKDGKLSREELRPAALPDGPRPPDDGPSPAPRASDRPPPRRSADGAAESIPPAADFGSLVVTSPAFTPGGSYPVDFTCDGAGVSPPLAWSAVPEGTRSFALNVWHVPPPGGIKSYWVIYNIPADVTSLPRNVSGIGVSGLNDKRRTGYDPMCSQGPGLKTCHITVYALSKELSLDPAQATREELVRAMAKVTLAQKTLTYQYERTGR